MHPTVMARRTQEAQARAAAAAQKLAARFGVEPGALEATARDPAVQGMLRTEALADALERAVKAAEKADKAAEEPAPAKGKETVKK